MSLGFFFKLEARARAQFLCREDPRDGQHGDEQPRVELGLEVEVEVAIDKVDGEDRLSANLGHLRLVPCKRKERLTTCRW